MPNKTFKLTFIASSLLLATSANAAIYQIVPITDNTGANQSFSSAISDSSRASDSNPLGCFADSATCGDTDYFFGGDTRQGKDGFSYRDEVPYRIDTTFTYLDFDDLKSYCFNELGYSTCESWANKEWFGGYSDNDEDDCDNNYQGGLCHERRAFFQGYNGRNAIALVDGEEITLPTEASYVPPGGTLIDDSTNAVINKVLDNGTPIGIVSSGYYDVNGNDVLTYRQRGFVGSTILLPKQDADETIVKQMGRTFAYDSFEFGDDTYVVGAASIAPFDNSDEDKDYYGDLGKCTNEEDYPDPVLNEDCQNFAFATQAYIWNSNNGASGLAAAEWSRVDTDSPNKDDRAAQGSARTAVVAENTGTAFDGKPVLAGFNTDRDDDFIFMQAAIFYPKDNFDIDSEYQWDTAFIKNTKLEDDDDYIYSNSLVTDINTHLVAIGETKRRGDAPRNGAANNRLFYTDASQGSVTEEPTAVYLTGNIFFSGAGGEANAINNYNEVVGAIDAEDNREIDGKERRRRGFIDPLDLENNGTNPDRLALFKGQSWWLDDLTNDGDVSGFNNQYRIVNATGINDDGVISATANFCEGGYDDTSHNSFCGGGTQTEKLVALKLIPIAGATSNDIIKRDANSSSVERSAGSLGYLAFAFLAFLGVRRRKVKA